MVHSGAIWDPGRHGQNEPSTLTFRSSCIWESFEYFQSFKKVWRSCAVIHADPWDVGPFQTQPCLDRTGAWELWRQGSHKGIFWSLDPNYAARPSAKAWVDRVSTRMKGLLLIPWSSDDGKRSRDRGGIWFPLQISKLKTNYPRDLKWWRQKPATYFHPKLILSFVCCVKLELMTGKAFKRSFSSPLFHVCGWGTGWKQNVIEPERWRSCSELLLTPHGWTAEPRSGSHQTPDGTAPYQVPGWKRFSGGREARAGLGALQDWVHDPALNHSFTGQLKKPFSTVRNLGLKWSHQPTNDTLVH